MNKAIKSKHQYLIDELIRLQHQYLQYTYKTKMRIYWIDEIVLMSISDLEVNINQLKTEIFKIIKK